MIITSVLVVALLSAAYFFLRKPKESPNEAPILSKESSEPSSLFLRDWPLLDFVLEFGPQMQVGQGTRSTGETYRICRFIKEDGSITRVYFFSQLGELTPSEIQARKNELYVGQMSSGKYYLHDKNVKDWKTVDLGI